MSFSSETKNEICRADITSKCCAIAESYGVLLFCNTFTPEMIRIVTESKALLKRAPKLFKRAFGITFDVYPENEETLGKLVLEINNREKINRIISAFGYESSGTFIHHINYGILEEECCRTAFVRGAFLAGGSITDPYKRYHLEIVTGHFSVTKEMHSILLDMGFEPKSTSRNGNYITYFKSSEAVEDFLTILGAPVAAMEVMTAKIEKDMQNTVNRKVNCDTANVTKTVNAAQEQLEAIKKIQQNGGLDILPEKLQETALIRIMNPELSLSQLAEMSIPKISKSCLSHRIRKIMEIAKKV